MAADVGVEDGRIVQIGGRMTDEPLLDAVARMAAEAASESLADFVLHPVIVRAPDDPEALARALASDGCVSVKIFTHMAGFTASPAGYIDMIAAAARHNLTVMAHCEDPALGEHLSGRAAGEPPGSSAVHYPADGIEVAAVARMAEIAAATAARIYLVHLSSGRSVDVALAARERGVGVLLETRPEYLLLTDNELASASGQEPGGGSRGRGMADIDRLWRAVADGDFDAICTDHAPWREAPARLPRSVRSGLSCLEVSRSLLFMKGVLAGRMTIGQLADLTAAGPARAFGLYPAKGVIAVGGDADLAVFDPDEHWRFAGGQSRAEWTPFDGWEMIGRTLLTIRRGTIIYRHGDGFPAGGGQRLRRRSGRHDQAAESARRPLPP